VTFIGPVPGSTVDAELLARACWALALLTEFYRAGPWKAANSPIASFADVEVADLLTLATPAALRQLAQIREVFETKLIPRLANRIGPWTVGPTFAGSGLVGGADADLVAAGMLLEVKTTAKKPSLGVVDLFQVVGYVLLDLWELGPTRWLARWRSPSSYCPAPCRSRPVLGVIDLLIVEGHGRRPARFLNLPTGFMSLCTVIALTPAALAIAL
jgi:hypothetical protein